MNLNIHSILLLINVFLVLVITTYHITQKWSIVFKLARIIESMSWYNFFWFLYYFFYFLAVRSRRRLKPKQAAEKYVGLKIDPDGFLLQKIDDVIGMVFFFMKFVSQNNLILYILQRNMIIHKSRKSLYQRIVRKMLLNNWGY